MNLASLKMMYEEASQVATDAVGSIRTVASFCAEKKMMQLYKKKCEGPMMVGIRQGLISGIGFGLAFFLLFCVYATSFYAGARLVERGEATFSDVFRVLGQPLFLVYLFQVPCNRFWTSFFCRFSLL